MVRFYSADRKLSISQKNQIKKTVSEVFEKEKVSLSEIKYIFCSDEFLFSMNVEFLKHRTYTDIITFNLSDKNCEVFGEVYISIDRVKENAKKFHCSFKQEVSRVIIHGALHLCGYNDKTTQQKLVMRRKEDFYLSTIMNVSRETL